MSSEAFALTLSGSQARDLPEARLVELAVQNNEGSLAAGGALVVNTGVHTGRSVQDKFVVRDATTEKTVWWDNTKAMSPAQFDVLSADFARHAQARQLYVQDLFAGADPRHRLRARIFTEF